MNDDDDDDDDDDISVTGTYLLRLFIIIHIFQSVTQ